MKRPDPLTPAEWTVMQAVWSHPEQEVNIREICDDLVAHSPDNPPAYSTVKTVMERLVEKGHLATRKRGNVGFFKPLSKPTEAGQSTVQNFVERMFDGVTSPLVSYLTNGARVSDEDIEKLKEFVAQQRSRRGGKQS